MKYWKLIAKILVSLLALFFVFSKLEWSKIWHFIQLADGFWLFLAVDFFVLSQIISAYRLNVFFKKINIDLPHIDNLQLYALGMFYNLILPGGVGGDGYKMYWLRKKYEVGMKPIFQALLLDRLVGLVALLILAIGLLFFLPEIFMYQKYTWIVLIVGLPVFYIFLKYLFENFISKIPKTLLQSLLVQLAQMAAAWAILKSLGLAEVDAAYLFLFLLSSIAAVVPITIGGAGARELVFLFCSDFFELEVNLAVAMSLLFYVTTVFISLVGGYFHFQKKEI